MTDAGHVCGEAGLPGGGRLGIHELSTLWRGHFHMDGAVPSIGQGVERCFLEAGSRGPDFVRHGSLPT